MSKKEYYRNNIDLQNDFNFVETDSLWYREGNQMILEDEDRYVTWDYNPQIFRQVN